MSIWQKKRMFALTAVSMAILFTFLNARPSYAAFTTTIVDNTVTQVGWDNSIQLNSSGFPVISYYNSSNSDLKVAICGDALCTSGNTLTTVDQMGLVGRSSSLVLNGSGFPVIAYYDETNNDLKLVTCGNALCASGNTFSVVDANITASASSSRSISLKLSTSGNPVISYLNDVGTTEELRVAICGDTTCTSGTTVVTIDSTNRSGFANSLDLTAGDIPIVSYYAFGTGDLRLLVCGNTLCSTGNTITPVDTTGNVGDFTSLKLNGSGFPVISYRDITNNRLKLATCTTLSCNTGVIFAVVDTGNETGSFGSLALRSDGTPVISHVTNTNGDLKVSTCSVVDCTSGVSHTIIDATTTVYDTSIVLSNDGRAVISYFDFGFGDLKVAVDLPPNTPTPTNTSTSTPTNTRTATSTFTQTFTATATSTFTPTFTETFTPTATSTLTPTFTPTFTHTFTPTATATLTSTFTHTFTPTMTHTPVPVMDTIGVFKDGLWNLRNSNSAGSPDTVALFGITGDLPVVGDWNNDGVDTLGFYRDGLFFLSNSNTTPAVDYNFAFGNPGDRPLAGKWDAMTIGSGVGVYRQSNGVIYLRRSLTFGFDDYYLIFGDPGDQPVAGDWNGNGFDGIGVYRAANQIWYLRNAPANGVAYSDIDFTLTIGTGLPLAGDWNADLISTVGYFTSTGVFSLHSTNATAGSDTIFAFGPENGLPVAGKWTLPNQPAMSSIIRPVGGNPVSDTRDGSD
jgi:hypothetical protein